MIEIQEEWNDFVVSHFELSACDMVHWFDGDGEMAKQFVHFAEGDRQSFGHEYANKIQKMNG